MLKINASMPCSTRPPAPGPVSRRRRGFLPIPPRHRTRLAPPPHPSSSSLEPSSIASDQLRVIGIPHAPRQRSAYCFSTRADRLYTAVDDGTSRSGRIGRSATRRSVMRDHRHPLRAAVRLRRGPGVLRRLRPRQASLGDFCSPTPAGRSTRHHCSAGGHDGSVPGVGPVGSRACAVAPVARQGAKVRR